MAPNPTGLASTTSVVGFAVSKYAMTGALTRHYLSFSKASDYSCPHSHSSFDLVNRRRGSAMVAMFGMNQDTYVTMPRNDLTSAKEGRNSVYPVSSWDQLPFQLH